MWHAEWGNPGQYSDLTARPAVGNICTQNRTDARILWLPAFNLCWQRLLASAHLKAQKIWKLSTQKHSFTCVGSDILTVRIMITIFRDVTPHSPVTSDWRLGGMYCLHLYGRRVTQAEQFGLLLDTEDARSSVTSINFNWTTWRRNPKDGYSLKCYNPNAWTR